MYSNRGWSYSRLPALGQNARRRKRPTRSLRLGVPRVALGPLPVVVALIAAAAWYQFAFGGFTVAGEVLDAQTHAPIAGAHVRSGASETFSGPDGTFQLAGVKPPELLGFEASGYLGQNLRALDPATRMAATLEPLQPAVAPTPAPAPPAVAVDTPTADASLAPTLEPTPAPTPVDTTPRPEELEAQGLVNPIPRPGAPASLLPNRRIVAYYGNPLASVMGVLGEAPEDQTVARLKAQAQEYANADPTRPVQPAIELITPSAQYLPGVDGFFRLRMPDDLIEEMAGWAERNNLLLILDVQVGQSTVQAELPVLDQYLRRPYVHLALDPEFDMSDRKHTPGTVIGTMDAADVNFAVQHLTDLVNAEHLPPKVLIVHRFLDSMVTNYADIRPNPSVQVVTDMDGFGPPLVKEVKYTDLVGDDLIQYGGVKLFYQQDVPLWTPQNVLSLTPPPDVVIYQ